MLNRVDADVVVTATPTPGGSVWMALANPSDATAVVGDTKHVAVTGVSVSDWSLVTTTTGTGAAPELGAADLWRQQDDAKGPVTLTVKQSGAPETLVVKTDGGQLSSLTMKVTDKSWFVEAVVAALIGLFLLVAGVVLLTSRRRHHHPGDGRRAAGAGRTGNHRPRRDRWSRGRYRADDALGPHRGAEPVRGSCCRSRARRPGRRRRARLRGRRDHRPARPP